jgi:hypothetical protein
MLFSKWECARTGAPVQLANRGDKVAGHAHLVVAAAIGALQELARSRVGLCMFAATELKQPHPKQHLGHELFVADLLT